MNRLTHSRALWNRDRLELASDEVLAQILERGEPAAWRDLYALAKGDAELRTRIVRLVYRAPLPLPRFWLAAMASLGEAVDLAAPLPRYGLSDT